jgi:predicted Zn-dependent protease
VIKLKGLNMNNLALVNLEKELKKLNSTRHGRRVFLASLPVLLSACATPSKTRYREGDNSGQKTKITVTDEKKMANEYLPQMQKDYPLVKDQASQLYIRDLGNKIVRANGLGGNPYNYEFSLVESKSVNAFALPAGKVFVTTPLLAMADTEAELAGVLGHEIGHIKARHTAERIEAQRKAQDKTILYTLGGTIGGAVLGYGLSKALCRKKDQECIQRISKYGAMAGAAGGLLIQKYGFMANSKEDEMEADRIGFRTSVAAGFHKDYVGRFYSKLLEMENKHKKGQDGLLASFADAMSTHPPSEKRVTQMDKMAASEKIKTVSIISSKDFERIKKKLA